MFSFFPSLPHFHCCGIFSHASLRCCYFYPSADEIDFIVFLMSSSSDLSGLEDLASLVFEGDEFCIPNIHVRFFKNCRFFFQADLS